MFQNARHPLAQPRQLTPRPGKGINDRQQANHRHTEAYRATAGFQHGYRGNTGNQNIGTVPKPGTAEYLIQVENQVAAGQHRTG